MAQHTSRRGPRHALHQLQDQAVGLCALGALLLVAPFFLGTVVDGLHTVVRGLQVASGLALLAGITLLVVHHRAKSRARQRGTQRSSVRVRHGNHTVKHTQVLPGMDPKLSASLHHPHHMQLAQAFCHPPGEQPMHWSADVFATIEWRRFEAVCKLLFAQAGFDTRSLSHGAQGGMDLWLHSRNGHGLVALVQCKHAPHKPVGVRELQEFVAVMAVHHLKRGTYATTTTFTEAAKLFAQHNSIHMLDAQGLLALIAKRTPEQQRALLAVAFEGEYWRPSCVRCGDKMLARQPVEGRVGFWGCSHYPHCRETLPLAGAVNDPIAKQAMAA